MKLLLDTHCWLWMQVSPDRFSDETRALLGDPDNDLYLSAASAWEIAIKFELGRLALPIQPAQYVPSRMVASGTMALNVEHRHALHVATLPRHHRDPFDRLIVAQAQLEGLPVLTTDDLIAHYDVRIVKP
jgi:PIN domain nuclease of toxin-antitoxin system